VSESDARSKTRRVIDEGLKPYADTSSEERNRRYSLKIRRKIKRWLIEHTGDVWDTLEDMHADAGNYAGCSQVTAGRWIHQLTRPPMIWEIVDTPDAYILRERREFEK
jgi:hypothetical protein